jgi:phosphoribosylaminoimidazolecarboxamide formyltransferase/IMP cyclohydrolase
MESRITRALLSVSDKTGLMEFAAGLRELGVEIISTGGTARILRTAGIPITEIDAFTGFPEMLDGRVKTLHPKVHAGILHRRDSPAHLETMKTHGLKAIDLVAVNLYPFEETVAQPGVTREEAIEQIDIGGPSMLRSAAKNHVHVTVVSSPEQYAEVLREMRAGGGATSLELRKRLALEVFKRTARYDAAIASFFESLDGAREGAPPPGAPAVLPGRFEVSLPRVQELRYGENPHQQAALYGSFLDHFKQLHGKELSYNNIMDLTAAQEMAEWVGRRGPTIAIIKHTNPCGLALGETVADAWRNALATDPQSASGGIIASSRPVDLAAASAMQDHFIDILVAPAYEPAALDLLRKKKNRILLEQVKPLASAGSLTFRSVPGGVLAQTADRRELREEDVRVVTKRKPADVEMAALRFGWDVVRFVKSNAIVYCTAERTLGIGAGQMSRVDSARIGAMKAHDAGLELKGCAVASDAFFPFPDGLVVAAEAGATAFIQPGGSVRDKDVIDAADSLGVAMVFTGLRHFRH